MTNAPPASPRNETRSAPDRRRAEKVAWWIVFSVLTVSILGMAGLWN